MTGLTPGERIAISAVLIGGFLLGYWIDLMEEKTEFEKLCAIIFELRKWFRQNNMSAPAAIELSNKAPSELLAFRHAMKDSIDMVPIHARGGLHDPERPEFVAQIMGIEITLPAIYRRDLTGKTQFPEIKFIDMKDRIFGDDE